MFTWVVVLQFWIQNILVYISFTTSVGGEAHLVMHQGRWGLSLFEIMGLVALGYAVYVLVTLGGVMVVSRSRITQLACGAVILTAFLNVAQPFLHERLLLAGARHLQEEYRVMLVEGIDNPYVEKEVIEYSRNLEIILRPD